MYWTFSCKITESGQGTYQIQLNWPVKVVAGSPIKKMEAVDG